MELAFILSITPTLISVIQTFNWPLGNLSQRNALVQDPSFVFLPAIERSI